MESRQDEIPAAASTAQSDAADAAAATAEAQATADDTNHTNQLNAANANVDTDNREFCTTDIASSSPLPLSASNCRLPNGDLVDSKNTCQSFRASPTQGRLLQPLATADDTAIVADVAISRPFQESSLSDVPVPLSEKHKNGAKPDTLAKPKMSRNDDTVQTKSTVSGVVVGQGSGDNQVQFKNPKESPLFLYHEHMTQNGILDNDDEQQGGQFEIDVSNPHSQYLADHSELTVSATTTTATAFSASSFLSPLERHRPPATTATVLSDSTPSESLILALANSLTEHTSAGNFTLNRAATASATMAAHPPPFAVARVMLDNSVDAVADSNAQRDEGLIVHLDNRDATISPNTTAPQPLHVPERPQDPLQQEAVSGPDCDDNCNQGPTAVGRRRGWVKNRVLLAAVTAVLVVIAVVAGSVCGSSDHRCGRRGGGRGNPSTAALRGDNGDNFTSIGSTTTNNESNIPTAAETAAARAQRIIEFINNVTLTGRTILVDNNATTNATNDYATNSSDAGDGAGVDTSIDVTPFLTAEEWALHWIIESDPLQLDLGSDANDSLSMASSVRIIQRYALLTLWFQQFQNQAWVIGTGWLTNPNECSWYGISCRDEFNVTIPNVVTRIELPANDLIGTLSPDLALLTSLQVFDVSENFLKDTIPDAYGERWTDLQSLILRQSLLNGPLPSSIGQWSLLQHFDVSDGLLSGTIPDSVGNWSNIRFVSLGYNPFAGSLPVALDQWPYLEHFNIYGNQLNGTLADLIGDVENNNNLTHFSVGSNLFSGTLPESSLGRWTNLRHFEANNCIGLRGSLPQSIENWSNIEFFVLSSNSLTGTLPESIRSWSNIERFEVAYNQLNGTIPDSSWHQMKVFSLGWNTFTGTLPESIGEWTSVVFLDVSNNQLTGTIPESVGRWRLAEYATFNGNNFSGTVPQGLCLLASNATGSSLGATKLDFAADCSEALACDCCLQCSSEDPFSWSSATNFDTTASIGVNERRADWS